MAVDSRTPTQNYPRPDVANTVSEDFTRLIASMNALDASVAAILTTLSGKSNLGHVHAISDVTGLQTALDGKQSTSWRPALGELANVNTTGAAGGQLLGFVAGQWQPVTLVAAQIPGLDASKVVSGTIDAARLPTGVAVPWANLTGVPSTFPPAAHTLGSHSDTNFAGITNGQAPVWNGSQWVPGTAGGGGFRGNAGLVGTAASGDIFRVHGKTLTQNTTIASNENAIAVGPLTVASGVTVTIEAGGELVVA